MPMRLKDDGQATARVVLKLRRMAAGLIAKMQRPVHLFTPNAARAALVVIDMQNFSCAPADDPPLPRLGSVVEQINRLAQRCRERSVPVIWVRQTLKAGAHGTDAGLFPLFHGQRHVRSMCNEGAGTRIFPDMQVDQSRDHVVYKNRYSAFLSHPPELLEKLHALKKTQLIITGVAANVCVESTVRDAMQLDYEVILVSDAVAAQDEILLECTLTNTRLFFGDVRTTEEVMGALDRKG